MSDMVRKQIYINKRQDELLKRLARQHGVSEAEIIRQAIDQGVREHSTIANSSNRSTWQEILRFVEERNKLGTAGEPYHWNREEIYEERENRWIRDQSQEKDQS